MTATPEPKVELVMVRATWAVALVRALGALRREGRREENDYMRSCIAALRSRERAVLTRRVESKRIGGRRWKVEERGSSQARW